MDCSLKNRLSVPLRPFTSRSPSLPQPFCEPAGSRAQATGTSLCGREAPSPVQSCLAPCHRAPTPREHLLCACMQCMYCM